MKLKNTAYIDRSALIANFRATQALAQSVPHPPVVMCVVKADAYGHGVEAVAGALGDAGCGYFAVSSEEEAGQLRAIESANGRHPEILILGHIMPENVGEMLRQDIICTAVSREDAGALSRAAAESGEATPLRIHVKLDTGMNRVGFPASEDRIGETVSDIAALAKDPHLKICGLFTHFSSADEELMDGHLVAGWEDKGGYTKMQFTRFHRAITLLEEAGVNVGMKHAANSAATLKLPEAYFDAVRAGVIIYGLLPNGSVDSRFTPVMRMDSTVTHLHTVQPGERVSYGAAFEASRPMVLATVAAGYADGFERAYAGCDVTVRGRRYRQVGRICMDQFMIDVTPENGEECPVRVGDAVTLFGGDDGTAANELARRAGTINYEVICKVSKRVPRVYWNEE